MFVTPFCAGILALWLGRAQRRCPMTDVCLVFIKWEGKWESLPPDPPK